MVTTEQFFRSGSQGDSPAPAAGTLEWLLWKSQRLEEESRWLSEESRRLSQMSQRLEEESRRLSQMSQRLEGSDFSPKQME